MSVQEQPYILIIDDNAQNVSLVSAQLEREGYWITSADSGEEGLLAAQTWLPDLIRQRLDY